MSRMLSKMNLISVVQQLPKEDIETIQGYVEMIEEENKKQKEVIDKVRNNLEKDISVIKNVKMSNKEIVCRLKETNKILNEVAQ